MAIPIPDTGVKALSIIVGESVLPWPTVEYERCENLDSV